MGPASKLEILSNLLAQGFLCKCSNWAVICEGTDHEESILTHEPGYKGVQVARELLNWTQES